MNAIKYDLIVDRRRRVRHRGRPPITPGERAVTLSVAIPIAVYDALTQIAHEADSDLAPLVRAVLADFSTKKSTRRAS